MPVTQTWATAMTMAGRFCVDKNKNIHFILTSLLQICSMFGELLIVAESFDIFSKQRDLIVSIL